MKIALKSGERLFINGAVIRAERKTSLELLNDAVFLLESHVLQPEQATTPLKQLYFILQTMIMDPVSAPAAKDMFHLVMASVSGAFSSPEVLDQLGTVEDLAQNDRWFEAMKIVRGLYPIEARLMAADHRARQEDDNTPPLRGREVVHQGPQLAVV
ncbi:flagellar biosynthesis repressor FlbT [Roseibium sp.]|uniref:flagellar biosynthesis repressor FlbT n=1 Tax=Roseibium sp. TaxID=1936156 RepID=UPI003B515C97